MRHDEILAGDRHGRTRLAGLHADRAAGGDRHHRHPDRPAAPRRPEGPRGRRPHAVHEQPQADRPGPPQLPRREPDFPPGYASALRRGRNDTGPGWGWAAYLLPHLEQDNLFRQIDFTQPIEPANNAGGPTSVKAYLCPADTPPSASRSARGRRPANSWHNLHRRPANYVGNSGSASRGWTGTASSSAVARCVSPTSPTGRTARSWSVSGRILRRDDVGRGRHRARTWCRPPARPPAPGGERLELRPGPRRRGGRRPGLPEEINHFSSRHAGGGNFLFADGHVSFLTRLVELQHVQGPLDPGRRRETHGDF